MFAFLGNLIQDLVSGAGEALVSLIKGILGGAVIFLTDIVDALGNVVKILDGLKSGLGGIYQGFLGLVSLVFPFLPAEWITILTTSILMTAVGVIIKKKVFGG